MSDIENIKVKGLDPKRHPNLRGSNYIDVVFELSQKAPRDWCADFNLLISRDQNNAKINPDEGLYIETWVRDMLEIQKELDKIKQFIATCNTNYIEQKNKEKLAFENAERSKADSKSDELDKVLSSLNYD